MKVTIERFNKKYSCKYATAANIGNIIIIILATNLLHHIAIFYFFNT